MKANDTSARAAEALPDIEAAQREHATLQEQLDGLKNDWLALETRMGDSYRDAAAGLPIDKAQSADLDALVARERVLRAQVKRAAKVLAQVQVRAGIRAVLSTEVSVAAECQTYMALGKKVAEALTSAAAALHQMVPIGERMVSLTLHTVRGGSTLTDKGFLSKGDILEVARPEHLVTLVCRDLNARLGWFPCEHSLMYGNPTFDVSVAGSASLFMEAVDVLFEMPHVEPAEIDAVREEMRAAPRSGVGGSAEKQQRPRPDHSRFFELEES